MQQLSISDFEIKIEQNVEVLKAIELFLLNEYDHIIVYASAGKEALLAYSIY